MKFNHLKEAARHLAAFLYYCDQSQVDAERGKRHMSFWCLEMAANHRRRYAAARAGRSTRTA